MNASTQSHLVEYRCSNGELLLYSGEPDLSMLEELEAGPGDVWHSSLDRGYCGAFPEMYYYATAQWWYVEDIVGVDRCASWKVEASSMVIRERTWRGSGGLDARFESQLGRDLDFGFRLYWRVRAVPMFVQGLFKAETCATASMPTVDRYLLFLSNFRREHTQFMLFRSCIRGRNPISELVAWKRARRILAEKGAASVKMQAGRSAGPVQGSPRISVIIPTMRRQQMTRTLLEDLAVQTLPPTEIIIVDATPEADRIQGIYDMQIAGCNIVVKWQQSLGSCRARNEALAIAIGDYIIFGDDDIRVPADYVERHVGYLLSTGADACVGYDVRAEHDRQTLDDLMRLLANDHERDSYHGLGAGFNNANSCVPRSWVDRVVGNDVNYDGGYGEDADFGLRIARMGGIVLQNPHAASLHLKPPAGGYRWWGSQSRRRGRRTAMPWQLGYPIKWIHPRPSPTIMYGIIKNYSLTAVREWTWKYLIKKLLYGPMALIPYRILVFPLRLLQYRKSLFFANRLMDRGQIFE